jgi:Protein of unknown function (DUF4240)
LNIDEFWQIIEDAKGKSGGNSEAEASLITNALIECSPSEILSFDALLDELRFRAFHWDVWAAAYIINGGCSEDCFEYFRCWLIAQGRSVFENALKDPDSLADVLAGDEEDAECEDMLYVAIHAYEARSGEEKPLSTRAYPEIQGVPWTEDNVDTRCPRLASLFWG